MSGTVRGNVVQAGNIGEVHFHSSRLGQVVPHQLPSAPRVFVSRHDELTELARWLGEEVDRQLLVVVSGPAGVGKTSLALRWLHDARTTFPDGQLYVDLGAHSQAEAAQPNEVLEWFLGALGVEPDLIPPGLAQRQALFRSVTADKSFAILFDDAASAGQVRPLLPASSRCVVVVTSRWRLSPLGVDGARFIEVGPMGVAASVELLEQIVGEQRLSDEAEAAEELAALCGGLPIALRVIGARLSRRPRRSLSREVVELRTESRRLSNMDLDGSTSVRTVLDMSYVELAPRQQKLYRLTAWHPGTSFGVEAAAAMMNDDIGEVEDELDDLIEKNLLTELGDDRFRFHDLLRLHARGQDDPEREDAIRRVVEWYRDRSVAADIVAIPGRPRVGPRYHVVRTGAFATRAEALGWLEHERDNLVHALRAAQDFGWLDLVWQMCEAMWALFQRRHHYSDWVLTHELGIRAAQECGEPVAEARLRNQLAVALTNLGRVDEALRELRAVLDHAGEQDLGSRATALVQLGRAHRTRGQLDVALDCFRQAVDVETRQGRTRGIGLARRRVGEVLIDMGRADDAVCELRECEALLDDGVDKARVWMFTARAHLAAGRHRDAEELLDAALVALQDSGSSAHLADVFVLKAEVAERHGTVEQARDQYRSALACYGDSVDPSVERIQTALAALDWNQDESAPHVPEQQVSGTRECECR